MASTLNNWMYYVPNSACTIQLGAPRGHLNTQWSSPPCWYTLHADCSQYDKAILCAQVTCFKPAADCTVHMYSASSQTASCNLTHTSNCDKHIYAHLQHARMHNTNEMHAHTHTHITPCIARSKDSSLMKVVFPDPVGPVNTVSSPGLWPFRIWFSFGNLCHCKEEGSEPMKLATIGI